MKQKTIKAICNLWNLLEDDDISTECLIEMIRGQLNLLDASDVVTGLVKGGIFVEETAD